ncbi:hypothetical protein V1477_002222 [Vespula maculifrons]|uniref:Uncharacterized protein n=1 Tax=Vespula maculifrons TaxID=7453 RepID=A0ABD2CW32_VESMC
MLEPVFNSVQNLTEFDLHDINNDNGCLLRNLDQEMYIVLHIQKNVLHINFKVQAIGTNNILNIKKERKILNFNYKSLKQKALIISNR